MSQEDKKWRVAFIPPDIWELMRDYIFAKGESDHIYSPKILVIRAVEEFLMLRGYKTQVEEIREAVKQKRPVRIFSQEKLTSEQKQAVALITKYRNMDEQQAIKWVLDHPEDVKAAVEGE